MKKVIIITEKYGELGNRLFRFARFFSFAQREKYYLFDLTFFQYSYLYAPRNFFVALFFVALRLLNNQRLKKIEKKLSVSPRVISWRVTPEQEKAKVIEFSRLEKVMNETSRRILLFTKGSFFFWCGGIEEQMKERLQGIFRLKSKYLKTAQTLLNQAGIASQKNKIVAVHIRQGDYKIFAGGIYYFEEAVYAASMRNLLATHQGSGTIAFVLITKEKINLQDFEGLPFEFFENQSIGVDQALLQLCDYIISPKSTFSSWPSFLYNIPQGIIQNKNIPLEWSDFQVAEALSQIN